MESLRNNAPRIFFRNPFFSRRKIVSLHAPNHVYNGLQIGGRFGGWRAEEGAGDMSKKSTLAAIDRAFREIDDPHHGFETVRDRLFRMNLESEKRHRKARPESCGLTATQAAKLFTVRHIAQGLENPDRWQVSDAPYIRHECLLAQAYAAEHRAEFLAAFERAGVTVADALAWDYSELMN